MIYSMPPDTREREKIVGGILDITQLAWLLAGAGLYVINALIMFRFFGVFALIFGLIFIIWGAVFAFKKKDEMPYPTYLFLKIRFRHKKKFYINMGCEETDKW